MTTLLPAFAGANTLYGAGMLELGMTFSLEQLVFDNDMISMTKKAMEGIPVNEETLSVEAIEQVGIGKEFPCTQDHKEEHRPPIQSKAH